MTQPIAPAGLQYRPFQVDFIRRARHQNMWYLADDMGVGKTVQAAGLINDDVTLRRVLIVCPAAVKLNWQRELQKWLVRDLMVDVGYSTRLPVCDILIINYDILGRNSVAILGTQWDLVVYDEAHMLKNPKAKRTQLAAQIRSRRLLAMSGTPLLNRPIELVPVLQMLGAWTSSYHQFGLRYCDAKQQEIWVNRKRRSIWDYSGHSNLDGLRELLYSTCMIRRTKSQVLTELPAKTRQIVPLGTKLPVKLRRAAALLEPPEGEDYLTQLARMTVPDSPEFEAMALVRHEIAKHKTKEAMDWIDIKMEDGVKLLIFAHHHAVLDALCERYATSGCVRLDGRMTSSSRQESVDAFQNDPDCHVLVGSIRAAGVGLTLTAAHHVVFVELDWVPGVVTQAEDRAHRMGQTMPVNIYHLVVDDSLDTRIASAVIAKQRIIDAVLDNNAGPTMWRVKRTLDYQKQQEKTT